MAQVPRALDPAPGKGPSSGGMARSALALVALLLLAAPALRADPGGADEAAFRQRNDDYVRAFLACDVARFRTLLADDFLGVLADGRLIDKAEFLRQAVAKPDVLDLRLRDVGIHVYGDAALVTALVTYHRAAGTPVRTRYSTLYVLRGGAWSVVWSEWTHASP